ncbi:MAG TPA: four helix bundle protein [Candidatus Cloacimonadota bacterium]|nr:four helix bundle protein [Candidatus Cloacimonadota bacterium]HPT71731.1 four helix bundle protein [Candidatus Cloacimonadota bacterium]
MNSGNVVAEKSYALALRIINLYKYFIEEKKEWIITKQLLRSGTSIGANIEEALGAQSKKDFISKISISYKETRETMYWLRLLKDAGYLKETQFLSMMEDCSELNRIISSILLTSKSNATEDQNSVHS